MPGVISLVVKMNCQISLLLVVSSACELHNIVCVYVGIIRECDFFSVASFVSKKMAFVAKSLSLDIIVFLSSSIFVQRLNYLNVAALSQI